MIDSASSIASLSGPVAVISSFLSLLVKRTYILLGVMFLYTCDLCFASLLQAYQPFGKCSA